MQSYEDHCSLWTEFLMEINQNRALESGGSHFTFWASPQHILLHFPINLLHFPIKFASFPQKNASFPQQFDAFPQQNASFPQLLAVFPYAMLCHFANIRKPDFIKYSHLFFYIFGI